ncbi:unnamed protein product [Rhizophagus irregularis]|nr:unnamed protein product [Rhizophagus irregularis]
MLRNNLKEIEDLLNKLVLKSSLLLDSNNSFYTYQQLLFSEKYSFDAIKYFDSLQEESLIKPFAPLHGTQGPLALSALQLRSFGSSLQLLSILDSMSLFFFNQ